MSPSLLPQHAEEQDFDLEAGRKVMQLLETARAMGDPNLIACAELAAYVVGCRLAQSLSDGPTQD